MNFSEAFIVITILFLCITVHEFAHAITADMLGDDTPRRQGRISVAPWAHLDPLGTIMIIASTLAGFGIGWGKPVLTNPRNYTINPRIGGSLVAFAGPLSNLIMAIGAAMFLRFGLVSDQSMQYILGMFVDINIALALFNLLPLYPLDGSHLLLNALPEPLAARYQQAMAQFGIMIFLALALTGVLGKIITPARDAIFNLLVGGGL